jgi:hypothetical protein
MAKQILSEEFRRMQKLAGLITENQYKKLVENEEAETGTEDPNIDDAIKGGASQLTNLSSLKEGEYESTVTTERELLNESITGLVVGGLLAAPKLMEWLGNAIKWIAKKLTGKGENAIANWLLKNGHKWEKVYIGLIIKAIKLTGFASQVWKKEDGSIDEQKLVTTAQVLYVVILAVAAGFAVKGALGTNSTIIKTLETTFGSVKVAEIVGFLGKIKSQI